MRTGVTIAIAGCCGGSGSGSGCVDAGGGGSAGDCVGDCWSGLLFSNFAFTVLL